MRIAFSRRLEVKGIHYGRKRAEGQTVREAVSRQRRRRAPLQLLTETREKPALPDILQNHETWAALPPDLFSGSPLT